MLTERIKKQLENIYQIYLSSGFDRAYYNDLTLSIIAWKALSDYSIKDAKHFKSWTPPASEFLFDNVMKNNGEKINKNQVEQALKMWEWQNKHLLKGLLYIDNNNLVDMPDDVWQRICCEWVDFFRSIPYSGMTPNENVAGLIIDYLESGLSNAGFEIIHYTPKQLVEVMVNFLEEGERKSLYDPYCRSGDLLYSAAQKIKGLNKIKGRALSRLPWKFANLRLIILNLSTEINIDTKVTFQTEMKFDKILTNPPFGTYPHGYMLPELNSEWYHLVHKSNRIDMAYLCHSLDHLSNNGRAVVILPSIFLSGQGTIKELRKRIIEKNILEAIISLPSGIFPETGVSTTVFVFDMSRKSENVFMLDATNLSRKSGKQVYLDEEKINSYILRFKEENYEGDKYARILSINSIKEHDWDLKFSSYDNNDNTFIKELRSSVELAQDCMALENEIKKVQERLNKLLANKKYPTQ